MSFFERKLKNRKEKFKQKASPQNSRSRRAEYNIKISHSKREMVLMKRRNITTTNNSKNEICIPPLEKLPKLVDVIKNSEDTDKIEECTKMIRTMLSVEVDPPIDQIIETGVVPYFVEFLKDTNNIFLQFESAWILSNICTGSTDQTSYVVNLDVIPIFISLLDSDNNDVIEQSVWALGNISGDSLTFRDKILSYPNSFNKILSIFHLKEINESILNNTTWVVSSLCRGVPFAPYHKVKKALKYFANLCKEITTELLINACWGLSYLSSGNSQQIDDLISTKCLPRVVELIGHQSPDVIIPALRTIGNVVTGNSKQTQTALDCDLLVPLKKLFTHKREQIQKEACWVLSNITAGTRDQIRTIIQGGFIPVLYNLISETKIYTIQKESIWALSNAVWGGYDEDIIRLVESGICEVFDPWLQRRKEYSILKISLEAYAKILSVGQKISEEEGQEHNIYAYKLERLGVFEHIEKLSNYENQNIKQLVEYLLNTYFYNLQTKVEENENNSIDQDENNNSDYEF
ncbi:importin subunit alpha [Anaeramoeba flamelloides]|uniref:Importin subunit alpha n=1 Tax=Anaeramoeba flamelloides TaxID=1746091 RepID=A0AAV7YQG9_9EUKA|nr:importin subunit alpha [Anaeramoeba flamelloides]